MGIRRLLPLLVGAAAGTVLVALSAPASALAAPGSGTAAGSGTAVRPGGAVRTWGESVGDPADGLALTWNLEGAGLDRISGPVQDRWVDGQVLSDQVVLYADLVVGLPATASSAAVTRVSGSARLSIAGNITPETSVSFPPAGEPLEAGAGDIRRWPVRLRLAVPHGVPVTFSVSVGRTGGVAEVLSVNGYLNPFVDDAATAAVPPSGTPATPSASGAAPSSSAGPAPPATGAVSWIPLVGGLGLLLAAALLAAWALRARRGPPGSPPETVYLLQVDPPEITTPPDRTVLLRAVAWRVDPTGAVLPAPEAVVDVTLSAPVPGIRLDRAGTPSAAEVGVHVDPGVADVDLEVVATSSGPGAGTSAACAVHVRTQFEVVLRDPDGRELRDVDLLADGRALLRLVAYGREVGGRDEPSPSVAVVGARLRGIPAFAADQVVLRLREDLSPPHTLTFEVTTSRLLLDSEGRRAWRPQIEVLARRRTPTGLGEDLPPTVWPLRVVCPHLRLWAVPGRDAGTVDLAVAAVAPGDWGRRLAGIPLRCRVEGPGSAPGSLTVASDERVETDAAGTAHWQLRWSGLQWRLLPTVDLVVESDGADESAREGTALLVDVGRNAQALVEAVNAHHRDPAAGGGLDLVNPVYEAYWRSVREGAWSARVQDPVWRLVTGAAWNLRCGAVADLTSPYICRNMAPRVVEWLLARRAGRTPPAAAFDPETAARMLGLEPITYEFPGLVGPHNWAAVVLAGDAGYDDPRAIDSWWSQDWPMPTGPDGLMTKEGERTRALAVAAARTAAVTAACALLAWSGVVTSPALLVGMQYLPRGAAIEESLALARLRAHPEDVVGPNGVAGWPESWVEAALACAARDEPGGPGPMRRWRGV